MQKEHFYERLSKHENPKFNLVGRRGVEWAMAHVANAEKQEKSEAIYGR